MQTDFVSVIVPAWNAASHLVQALESVLGQTHSHLELIVINDSSDDETDAIVQQFASLDTRVSIIRTVMNSGGPAVPRNLGMQRATGEFIAFLDADDIWHADKLRRQLAALYEHKLSFISTRHIEFQNQPPSTQLSPSQTSGIRFNSHEQLIRKNNVTTSSALIRRADMNAVQFNESAAYIAVEDYLMWLHLHQQANFRSAILSDQLVYYRRRAGSLSSSRWRMAIKIYRLLGDYEIDGARLGWRRAYYFMTYVALALGARLRHASDHS